MTLARLISTAFLVAPVCGWVTKSQAVYGAQLDEIRDLMNGKGVGRQVQAQLGYLWSMPETCYENGQFNERGLCGGITWAWDPKLCSLLEPRFKEDTLIFGNYINCADFKSAVSRAFDKWSANNRHVRFVDVTNECEKLGLDYGPPTDTRSQPEQPHGGCALAEIWVTNKADPAEARQRRLDGGHNELIEDGEEDALTASTEVASARSHGAYSSTIDPPYTFRYTNGERPHFCTNNVYPCEEQFRDYERDVVEVVAGTFSFNTQSDVCWYLDSQWCSHFHELKHSMGSAESARLVVEGTTYGAMMLSGLFFVYVFYRVIKAAYNAADIDKDGVVSFGERMHAVALALAEINPLFMALALTWFIVPPLIVTKIFAPCFDCYDFEAATLHEIGHFLGLGHPDNIPDNWLNTHALAQPLPGVNSYQAMIAAGGRTLAANCKTLWNDVHEGVPENATLDTSYMGDLAYPVRNAQMESKVQHDPKSCLRDDDVEALAVLYPDCGARSLSTAVCHKVNHNIGLMRVMVFALGPFIIILLVVVVLEAIMEHFERQVIQETKAELVVAKWRLAGKMANKFARRTSNRSMRSSSNRRSSPFSRRSGSPSSAGFLASKFKKASRVPSNVEAEKVTTVSSSAGGLEAAAAAAAAALAAEGQENV